MTPCTSAREATVLRRFGRRAEARMWGGRRAAPPLELPGLADRFHCSNELGALVSNSMGDT
jgi:hypothetical protein